MGVGVLSNHHRQSCHGQAEEGLEVRVLRGEVGSEVPSSLCVCVRTCTCCLVSATWGRHRCRACCPVWGGCLACPACAAALCGCGRRLVSSVPWACSAWCCCQSCPRLSHPPRLRAPLSAVGTAGCCPSLAARSTCVWGPYLRLVGRGQPSPVPGEAVLPLEPQRRGEGPSPLRMQSRARQSQALALTLAAKRGLGNVGCSHQPALLPSAHPPRCEPLASP